MVSENLGHHVQGDQAREEEIKGYFKTAEESSALGPQEIREQQVRTPEGHQTLHSISSSFQISDVGEWTRKETEEVPSFACGCFDVSTQDARICAISGQLVCLDHTAYCVECCRPVWVYYSEIKGSDVYCTSCLKKTGLRRVLTHFQRLFLTILWGLAGRDYTQEHPSLSNKPLRHFDGSQFSTSPRFRPQGESEASYQRRASGRTIRRPPV